MIGRCFKNIWRLKGVYLPLFLSLCFFFLLNLVCSSVIRSSHSALDTVGDSYNVLITITVKERIDWGLDSCGSASLVNTNTSLIDNNVLNILSADQRITNIRYITNLYSIPVGIICSYKQFEEIREKVSAGEKFESPPKQFYSGILSPNEIVAVGVTDFSYVQTALGVSETVTYTSESRSGAILPVELYEFYGRPETLVFGWQDYEDVGSFEEADGGYKIRDYQLSDMLWIAETASAPSVKVAVAGYYNSDTTVSKNKVIFDSDTWDTLYQVSKYYEHDFDSEEKTCSAYDDVGIMTIEASLSSPEAAEKLICDLIDCGLSAADYLISADDYDYKFAVSQIESVEGFARVVYVMSLVICAFVGAILVYYTVRCRSREITVLWLLGVSKVKIFCGMILEIFAAVSSAGLAGIGAGKLVGTWICSLINIYVSNRAKSSVDRMSQITRFMSGGDFLREQLENAIESFSSSGFTLNYQPGSDTVYAVVAICVLLLIYASLVIIVQVSLSYVKRSELYADS